MTYVELLKKTIELATKRGNSYDVQILVKVLNDIERGISIKNYIVS